jgi:hypothetical protein
MYYAPRSILRSRPMPHPTTCILPAVRRDGWGLRLAGRALSFRAVLLRYGTATHWREGVRTRRFTISVFPSTTAVFRYFGILTYIPVVSHRGRMRKGAIGPFTVSIGAEGRRDPARRPITPKYSTVPRTVRYCTKVPGPASTGKTNTTAQAGYRKRPDALPRPSLASPISASSPRPSPPLPTTTLFQSSSVASSAAQRPAREAGWCIYGPVPLANVAAPARRCTTDHRPPPHGRVQPPVTALERPRRRGDRDGDTTSLGTRPTAHARLDTPGLPSARTSERYGTVVPLLLPRPALGERAPPGTGSLAVDARRSPRSPWIVLLSLSCPSPCQLPLWPCPSARSLPARFIRHASHGSWRLPLRGAHPSRPFIPPRITRPT